MDSTSAAAHDTKNGSLDPASICSPNMIVKHCAFCGKELTVKAKGRPRIYCSNPCRDKAYRNRLAAKGLSASSSSKTKSSHTSKKNPVSGKERSGSVSTSKVSSIEISPLDIQMYKDNPFVSIATSEKIVLSDSFYIAARPFRGLEVEKLFAIFELNISNFNEDEIKDILDRVKNCPEVISTPESVPFPCTDTALRIMFNRMSVMDLELERICKGIGSRIHETTKMDRKELCQMIRNFPKDPSGRYTISHFLELLSISRNSFYCYTKNERYGLDIKAKDDLDAEYVRKAYDYKGFNKGVRQVYMLLPRLTNRKIGLERVRRIMRTHGMLCNLRTPNPHKQSRAKYMKEHTKPNLLKRMFKLHRPNEVRVTDVTYITLNNDQKFYGSALMDPVTNMLTVFIISESNDEELAMETLRQSDSHPCKIGGTLHSDQGVLYLSQEFQDEVGKMGLEQSMSKRGNCWDNCVIESWFAVFKTESNYLKCNNIDELRQCMEEFKYYYNYERGHWDHDGMTPAEYESYLESMSDIEFSKYLEVETKKYNDMKEKAAEKAKIRAQTLGV